MLPDHALREHAVLVERDQAPQHARRQQLGQDHVRRPVALHHPVGGDRVGRALGPHLLLGLAERQRLGLREHVGHQQVVVVAQRVERLGEADQVDRDQLRALVDQLVEAVLAVGPGLAPEDRAGLVVDVAPVERDVLAVRLHRQLLEVGGKALEVLLVGHHAVGLGAEEVAVPDGEQAHQRRQVALERGAPEVLVHLVEAGEHLAEALRTDGQHRREADRRVHRVPPADPLPEAEHVVGVDPELAHLLGVGGDGDEVLGDRALVGAERVQRPFARRAGVGHRLERGERLGGDDEQRLLGVRGRAWPRRSRWSRRWRRSGRSCSRLL